MYWTLHNLKDIENKQEILHCSSTIGAITVHKSLEIMTVHTVDMLIIVPTGGNKVAESSKHLNIFQESMSLMLIRK
jgi:hypothetical protein